MPNYSFREGVNLSTEEFLKLLAPFAVKFQWFMEKGYEPHTYQAMFHTLTNEDETKSLCRYRHLVAGRRGGKTLSAAWEVLFYALHPEHWHFDRNGITSDKALHIWILGKDHKIGRAALLAMREVIVQAGLVPNVDYKENRGDLYFEFSNGTLVEFKTAVDPQSLRGAGLDILWIDEAAMITSIEAWNVVKPALMNKRGGVICTTTPQGKNWYYTEFFGEQNIGRTDNASVEYRSIDNPYFPKESWIEEKLRYHPLLFKQEYEASFDSMAGRELPGEWLTNWFYTDADIKPHREKGFDIFIGVDPASSLSDDADHFVICAIGVSKLDATVFLLDMWMGRLPFAEQLQIIADWHIIHHPHLIGVESNAYQSVLSQQAARMPNLPPIVPMLAKGKKSERILSMSPLFRVGKCRVRETDRDFINQWLNYDTTLKNPEDDCLDAIEIALRTAGALMPPATESLTDLGYSLLPKGRSFEDWIKADLPGNFKSDGASDEHLGAEW